MVVNITSYRVLWSDGSNPKIGGVDLYENNNAPYRLRSVNPIQISLWVDILRNEKPVLFDTGRKILYTGREPLGEGEF